MSNDENKDIDSLELEDVNPWDLLDNLVLSNVKEWQKILKRKWL